MKNGKVYLVGAGIGEADNITVKAKKILETADVVVHDRLLNRELLNGLPSHVELIDVGKSSSEHLMKQEDINDLLVQKARKGLRVVRLKGGDPYVFGRGGEEGEVLYSEGVDFEVVPGITSGIAGLCYAGIPITHRDFASSLHLITGHRRDGGQEIDYATLSVLEGTLVFYMGLKNLGSITRGLLDAGKPGRTPVAVISQAGYPRQCTVCGSLETIEELAGKEEGLVSPSLIVVGEVISLRDKLNFFERRPLFGKKIVVTRAREQISGLATSLKELGAEVIELPSIKIVPKNLKELSEEVSRIEDYTHLIFTSKNGVDIFMEALLKEKDARSLFGLKICAIGSGTEAALLEYGLRADILPGTYVAESLFEKLKGHLDDGSRVLLPRAEMARDYLRKNLETLCSVNEIHIYDTLMEEPHQLIVEKLMKDVPDYITFTSSSTVRNTVSILEDKADLLLKDGILKIISIGPITSSTVEEYGYKVHAQAWQHDIKTLVEVLIEQEEKNK
ncbi:MAG: uroporphyrinogen-III C-methyltransferase [Filifactor alocis]|nr:uroporphyrinogen-III C-methyltransferase [Filifactor alocis]